MEMYRKNIMVPLNDLVASMSRFIGTILSNYLPIDEEQQVKSEKAFKLMEQILSLILALWYHHVL
jgi:hypothetical protein